MDRSRGGTQRSAAHAAPAARRRAAHAGGGRRRSQHRRASARTKERACEPAIPRKGARGGSARGGARARCGSAARAGSAAPVGWVFRNAPPKFHSVNPTPCLLQPKPPPRTIRVHITLIHNPVIYNPLLCAQPAHRARESARPRKSARQALARAKKERARAGATADRTLTRPHVTKHLHRNPNTFQPQIFRRSAPSGRRALSQRARPHHCENRNDTYTVNALKREP